MVIYIDMLFLINFIADFLLLSLTAYLRGVSIKNIRLVIAAGLGGLLAVGCFFMRTDAFESLILKTVICCFVALTAFGYGGKRRFAGDCIMMCAVSFIFSGGIIAVSQIMPETNMRSGTYTYFDISLRTLIIGTFLGYFAMMFFFQKGSFKHERTYKTVKCTLSGADIQFKAYVDTGNMAVEPVSGRNVIMVSPSVVKMLLSGREKEYISELEADNVTDIFEKLANISPGVYGLLPFKTSGGRGLTITLKPETIEIDGKISEDFILGVSIGEIETVSGCSALIGC